jgi:hypothetical protein
MISCVLVVSTSPSAATDKETFGPILSNPGTMPVVVKRPGDFVKIGVMAEGYHHVNVKATVTGGGTQQIITLGIRSLNPVAPSMVGYISANFEGQFFVQPNRTSQDIPYIVRFEASDDAGNIATLAGQSFIVEAKDRIAPQILSFRLSNTTLNCTGGNITAFVDASDDCVVKQVRVIQINPDGTQSVTPPIALVRATVVSPEGVMNGQWKHSWTIFGNSTTTPQVYGVKATVSDGSNLTTSRTISVTVFGKPPTRSNRPRPLDN